MKIIFVNRYFYPDTSQTSRLLSDLAFELVQCGGEVHVITSRMRTDDPAAVLPPHENINGVQVHRVWTSRFGRRLLPGRAMDYLTFHLATERRLLAMVERGDRVVAKSDPPMLSALVGGITRRRNAVQINWLHEIFPEVAVAMGVKGLGGRIGQYLISLRSRALNHSYMTVVPSEAMRQRLLTIGLADEKLRVIRDWTDGRAIRPKGDEDNPLREEWGLRGKFILGYLGELGKAHDYTTLLSAADRLRSEREIRFLIVAEGALLGALKRDARKRNLTNLVFQPPQQGDRLGWSMALPDIHLVVLRPEMEGLMLPGKFYRAVAAGKPILYIGQAHSEVGEWVHRARIGTSVEPGDGGKLARRILLMRLAPESLSKMGENARKLYRARFSKSRSLAAWAELIGLEHPKTFSGSVNLDEDNRH